MAYPRPDRRGVIIECRMGPPSCTFFSCRRSKWAAGSPDRGENMQDLQDLPLGVNHPRPWRGSPPQPGRQEAQNFWAGTARRAQQSTSPFTANREAERGQGAKRRHQPTGARGAAGAHTARQGPEGAQRQRSRRSSSGAARRAPRAQRPRSGAQSEPLVPPDKLPHKAPEGATGKRGAGAEGDAGGKRGEPPRRKDAPPHRRGRSSGHAPTKAQGEARAAKGRRSSSQRPKPREGAKPRSDAQPGAQAAGTTAAPGAGRAERAAKRKTQRGRPTAGGGNDEGQSEASDDTAPAGRTTASTDAPTRAQRVVGRGGAQRGGAEDALRSRRSRQPRRQPELRMHRRRASPKRARGDRSGRRPESALPLKRAGRHHKKSDGSQERSAKGGGLYR